MAEKPQLWDCSDAGGQPGDNMGCTSRRRREIGLRSQFGLNLTVVIAESRLIPQVWYTWGMPGHWDLGIELPGQGGVRGVSPSPWFLSATGFSSHTSCPTAPHPHSGLYWTVSSTPQVSSGPLLPTARPSPSRSGVRSDPGQHGTQKPSFPRSALGSKAPPPSHQASGPRPWREGEEATVSYC